MIIFVFMMFALFYFVVSKTILLPDARGDIQAEYFLGDVAVRFYILSILPLMYIKGK